MRGATGPKGDTGDTGPRGPEGTCDCPFTQEQINALAARIYELEKWCYPTRFTDMGDGTIKDNTTGRFWLKDASAIRYMNWADAKQAVFELCSGNHGLTDGSTAGQWGLPSKADWEAFVDKNYTDPALCNTLGTAQWTQGDAFTNVSGSYWSDQPHPRPGDGDYVWAINMSSGELYDMNTNGFRKVWPTRR